MKKIFFWALILLGVCFFFLNREDDEIRIRVISNSELQSDIEYKEEVVKYLKDEILINEELTKRYFEKNYSKIQQQLNNKFENIKVTFEKHTFKNKTYNGSVLKDEEYPTLLIVIGEGLGPNWWGSIFDEALKNESSEEIVYQWYFKKEETYVRN